MSADPKAVTGGIDGKIILVATVLSVDEVFGFYILTSCVLLLSLCID